MPFIYHLHSTCIWGGLSALSMEVSRGLAWVIEMFVTTNCLLIALSVSLWNTYAYGFHLPRVNVLTCVTPALRFGCLYDVSSQGALWDQTSTLWKIHQKLRCYKCLIILGNQHGVCTNKWIKITNAKFPVCCAVILSEHLSGTATWGKIMTVLMRTSRTALVWKILGCWRSVNVPTYSVRYLK